MTDTAIFFVCIAVICVAFIGFFAFVIYITRPE